MNLCESSEADWLVAGEQAVIDEREACARLVERLIDLEDCLHAIRALEGAAALIRKRPLRGEAV